MLPPRTKPIKSVFECTHPLPIDPWSRAKSTNVVYSCPEDYQNRKQMLMCHDMRGGYLEDAFVQGVFPGLSSGTIKSIKDNERNGITATSDKDPDSPEYPATAEQSTTPDRGSFPPYVFQHWSRTSIFVYFSHERFTIPPVTWTQAAHQNGVRILGTFITEWEPGKLENERWILGTESPRDDDKPGNLGEPSNTPGQTSDHSDRWNQRYADRMVRLAVEYGFDGWFINLESELVGTRCTPQDLKEFLRYLTREMHRAKPNSLVLWYDSLTTEGTIDWQNMLNAKNAMFMKVTDGFFSNYTWKESYPKESTDYATEHFSEDARWQVFTGNDMYGRGTFGGGGFDIDVALKVIQKAKTSVAIFAPGWTYEGLERKGFLENEQRLWYDPVKGISRYAPPRTLRSNAYFYTNFDRGFGKLVFVEGKHVYRGRWYHIGTTSVLPDLGERNKFVCSTSGASISTPEAPSPTPETISPAPPTLISFHWSPDDSVAYNGGTSLRISFQADLTSPIRQSETGSVYYSRLYLTRIHLPRDEKVVFRFKLWRKERSPDWDFGVYTRIKGKHKRVPEVYKTDAFGWTSCEQVIQGSEEDSFISEIGVCARMPIRGSYRSTLGILGYVGEISIGMEEAITPSRKEEPWIRDAFMERQEDGDIILRWTETASESISHVHAYLKQPNGEWKWLGRANTSRFFTLASEDDVFQLRPVDMHGRERKGVDVPTSS